MRLPRTVRVGPHRYRLVIDRNGLLEQGGACNGLTVPRRLVLAVDGTLEGTALAEVVVHELLHACMAGLGLDDELEERVADGAAGRLLGVIRDNPALIRAISS